MLPRVRENECVELVSRVLYGLGSEYVEGQGAARRTRTCMAYTSLPARQAALSP
jgi:hypothetical protein